MASRATEFGVSPPRWWIRSRFTASKYASLNTLKSDDLSAVSVGKFIKEVDKALPGKHTRLLYDDLTKSKSAVLVQLHSGKCQLNEYLATISGSDPELFDCGIGAETVKHFVFSCSRWINYRDNMKVTGVR